MYAAVAAGLVAVGVVAYVLSAPPDDPPQPKEKQPKPKKKKVHNSDRFTRDIYMQHLVHGGIISGCVNCSDLSDPVIN